MPVPFRRILFAAAAVLLSFAQNAFSAGSGAFRLEVPHAGAFGKGSAFIGEADDPSAIYYNPAGLTQLKGQNSVSLGYSVIQPLTEYEDNSGNETQMRPQVFLIPHLYFVSDFGLDKLAFGFGGGSNWGLGTYWAEESFSKYVATKADLLNKDIMMTMAYKLNDGLSFGVGVDYDNSYVNKKKKLIQLGGADGDYQLKGRDAGFGYRLSTHYQLNDRHQFGLQYKSIIQEKYKGKLYFDNLNAAGSNYLAIFGDTNYETEITAESTLPQIVAAGYSYQPNDKWTLNLDVEWTDWSSTEQEKLNYESESNATRLAVLNTGNPADRDWKSVFSYAVGVERKASDKLRLRAGYYYHQTPIPEANFETNLPDSNSHGLTTGFGYDVTDDFTFDFAYSALIYEERDIDNSVGSGSGASIDGKYRQLTNIYMMTFNYQF